MKTSASSFRSKALRYGGKTVLVSAIVIIAAVLVNLLVSRIPVSYTQIDITANKRLTLSEETKSLLENLSEPINVYWVVAQGEEDDMIDLLLDRYQALNGRIKVEKKNPDLFPSFIRQYTSETINKNSLIVESEKRFRYVDYYDIFEFDYTNYAKTGNYDLSFAGERALSSAIEYVTMGELPVVLALSGHGETELSSKFKDAVENANYTFGTLNLLQSENIDPAVSCVLAVAPQTDLTDAEAEILTTYLEGGGSFFLITEPPKNGRLTNLEAILDSYGVRAVDGIAVERNNAYYAYNTQYYLLPELVSHPITDPLLAASYHVLLPLGQGLVINDDLADGLRVRTLLASSGSAFSKIDGYNITNYEKEKDDIGGPFSYGVVIEKEGENTTDIVWVSSASLTEDSINELVSGANEDFFLNSLNWLCERNEEKMAIHTKSLNNEFLSMPSGTASVLTVLILILIPAAYLAIGAGIWAKRKRK